MKAEHPSYLQLDRLAGGGDVDAQVRAHVAQCVECTAHVNEIRKTEALPRWLTALDDLPATPAPTPERRPRAERRSHRWDWRGPAVALAAAAGLAAVMLDPVRSPTESAHDEPAYSTVRGAPSVGLYVKRGPRVWLWNGIDPVRPDDRLRLKVSPEGYRHVAVFIPDGDDRTLVYSAPVEPTKTHLVPRAWRVDDEEGQEALIIVLAHDRGTAEGATLALTTTASSTWRRTLQLNKDLGGRR